MNRLSAGWPVNKCRRWQPHCNVWLSDWRRTPDSALLATEQESEADAEASFGKVISQSRSVLFDAQEAIIAYVSEQWQSEHLQQVPDQLRDLAGQLSSVGFAAPALILENCAEYLASNIIAQQLVPDWQKLRCLS